MLGFFTTTQEQKHSFSTIDTDWVQKFWKAIKLLPFLCVPWWIEGQIRRIVEIRLPGFLNGSDKPNPMLKLIQYYSTNSMSYYKFL